MFESGIQQAQLGACGSAGIPKSESRSLVKGFWDEMMPEQTYGTFIQYTRWTAAVMQITSPADLKKLELQLSFKN